MLHIILPVAFIFCITADIYEYTEAIGFISLPIPLEYIAVSMSHPSLAASLALGPMALIL